MTLVDAAAKRLYESIQAPRWSFNTLAFEDSNGHPYIRVLVDPDYMSQMLSIPRNFENFRVSVEPRDKAFALAL
jgi:hypothetical protein